MVLVKLLFFAKARDLTGISERSLKLADGEVSLENLKAIIAEAEPSVKPVLDSSIVAVNLEYVTDSIQIGTWTTEVAAYLVGWFMLRCTGKKNFVQLGPVRSTATRTKLILFRTNFALGVCRYFYIGVEQLVKVQDAEKAITSISRYMHCPNYLHSIQITKFYLRSIQSEYLGGHSEGKTVVKLTRDSLDISEGLAQVTAVDCGAVSMFLGTTRSDVIDGDIVSSLIYEAYDAMALKEMQKLCEEVRNTYSIKHIVLLHRLGRIPVKEASVMIVCSGRHRQDTLRSTEWLINKLKSRVPIWKREVFAGGSEAWKENKEAFWRQ